MADAGPQAPAVPALQAPQVPQPQQPTQQVQHIPQLNWSHFKTECKSLSQYSKLSDKIK